MSRIRTSRSPISILAAHLCLGVPYGAVVSIWEAPDDRANFAYVDYLTTNRSLFLHLVDEQDLTLPADSPDGEYGLLLGLYLLDTMGRLPAFDAEGTRLDNGQVVLPAIEMVR